jgi:hypothetical protein
MAGKKSKCGKAAKGDYTVGYGKPPAHTRYQPGCSGNPAGGRKRKQRRLQEDLDRIFAEKITVIEDGKRRRISKGEASIRRLLADALRGDKKALAMVVSLMKAMDAEEFGTTVVVNISERDADL